MGVTYKLSEQANPRACCTKTWDHMIRIMGCGRTDSSQRSKRWADRFRTGSSLRTRDAHRCAAQPNPLSDIPSIMHNVKRFMRAKSQDRRRLANLPNCEISDVGNLIPPQLRRLNQAQLANCHGFGQSHADLRRTRPRLAESRNAAQIPGPVAI